ncbi:MAG: hypothetical protein ABSE66_07765 [Thermoplasmata archaeon]
MTGVRPRFGDSRHRAVLLAVVGLALLTATVVPLGLLGGPPAHPTGGSSSLAIYSSPRDGDLLSADSAATIGALGPVPAEVTVGAPAAFAWQALDAGGARVTAFAVDCELAVTESTNDSNVPAWANASTTGPLARSANGTFSVPSAAWKDGVLNLTVSFASAVPVTVQLFGPLLPVLPAPVVLAVLPDLDHLVLYDHGPPHLSSRSNDTYWHVRDRFGDPTPGAFLIVEYSNLTSVSQAFVPVTWAMGGTTGAWVNYSTSGSGDGTLEVTDKAHSTLLGPVPVPAVATPAPPPTASLSPLVLAATLLLVVGAVVGMGTLLFGGRTRPSPAPTDGEEELRRLAEGRETIVDLVRRAGALGLHEIEATWEPPPAPPALADWVASLVTDGTLTVTLGEGGRARFALSERPGWEPRVTLDEDALERGVARRDAAVEGDDEEAP